VLVLLFRPKACSGVPETGRRLAAAAAVLVLAAVPLAVRDEYYLHLCIVAGVFVIAVLGLDLIVGYVGQLSLAHAAFFALGAYTSGLLFVRAKWSMWLGLPAAAIATA
jgi:branched-chain amino acid transport system permease protein